MEIDYESALADLPLAGVSDRPLVWENVELAEADQEIALVTVVQQWESLVHKLTYAPVPRSTEDLALLWVLATDDWASEMAGHHAGVSDDPNPDPWVGPQWIRVLDVDAMEQPATVTLCFDRGYYGRESQGGGVEMFREHRALLVVYSLVPELVPELGERWKVSHERPYAGDDYPEPNTGPDRECKEWANHDLTDVPDS
ncbi:hypothetical protein JQS43_23020 [Natronosporangium hydrolyticum]|uniref:Uncharacterized protein n=1 Tax=Natronosporangium hydrolyticum TaxID=2811111 RepID=A0A895Y9A5_9ACTN|nr:hypothetical protein [Natronosporangium hydrolyticum]QSB14334.1 hypothetical protein JQS43_23020 [Natronosporangium hydrolyticum]